MDASISFPAHRAGKDAVQAMLNASGRGNGLNLNSFQQLRIFFVENADGGG